MSLPSASGDRTQNGATPGGRQPDAESGGGLPGGYESLDCDKDGLANIFERQYAQQPTGLTATTDVDGMAPGES